MITKTFRCFTVILLASLLSCNPANEGEGSPAWHVDPDPSLDIAGSLASEVDLEFARDATFLRDGTLVVLDEYAGKLHFFDGTGRFLRSVGRMGPGPGEFSHITWIGRCQPDSLFVWDTMKREMFVFDTLGTFSRQFRPAGQPHEFDCLEDGTLLVMDLSDQLPPPGEIEERPLTSIWIGNQNGEQVRALGMVPFLEMRPVGISTRIAVGGGKAFVGTADSAWVDVYGLDGSQKDPVRLGGDPRPPTQANVDRAIDMILSTVPDRQLQERYRPTFEAIPDPRTVPPYSDLRVDPQGMLWAVVSIPGDSVTILQGLEVESGTKADVVLPPEFHVFEIGYDYILGMLFDEQGEQHIVTFRLSRPEMESR